MRYVFKNTTKYFGIKKTGKPFDKSENITMEKYNACASVNEDTRRQ
jgi:hypothetical protein